MTLSQIRLGIIISTMFTVISSIGMVIVAVSPKSEPALNAPQTNTGSNVSEIVPPIDVLGESIDSNFIEYKSIFERALAGWLDKKTVEFYEIKINNPKIRYHYQTDYRNKRYYRYAEYSIEDFASIEEIQKKLGTVKEAYIDGTFYIIDTKGLTTVAESDVKKFENSTIHLNDIKEAFEKYLFDYEAENGNVSVMLLDKADEIEGKTRYGFQSATLGDAVIIMDNKFNVWEISMQFRDVYTTFVFQDYDTDLNIVPLEEELDLNINPEVSPSPEPSPSEIPSPQMPTTVVLPEATPIPSPTQVLGANDTKITPPDMSGIENFELSGNCARDKGSCYLKYTKGSIAKKLLLNQCNDECDSRRTLLSVSDSQYQYIVEAWRNSGGYTKLYKFDKNTEKLATVESINQNILVYFDITKIDTYMKPEIADYSVGCDKPNTAGLYCIGNLNKMSEQDVTKIDNFIKYTRNFYNTYIEPFQSN